MFGTIHKICYDLSVTGKEFRKWREGVKMTQAQVAKILEVTDMTVYRWETDKAPISKSVELALKQIEASRKES